MNSKLIILSAEKNNWAPKELEKKAKEKFSEVIIIDPTECSISLFNNPIVMANNVIIEQGSVCLPRMSEDYLDFKCSLISHIEDLGIIVINSAESLRLASNKIETQRLLNKCGLKTPKTVLVVDESQIKNALNKLDNKFPIIIKTLYGTHGIGVIRADSEASLISIAQQLIKSKTEFMLQEYIEHTESGRILLIDGEIIASVMRTVPNDSFRSNAHLGAELKAHEPTEQELDACKKAAKALDINLAAVDYIVHDDDIIILEVNGSPGFEAMQKVITDIDIAEKIIEHCLSKVDTDKSEPVEVEQTTIEIQPSQEPSENEVVDVPKAEQDGEEIIIPIPNVEGDNVVGSITNVVLKFFNNDEPIEARVDTGATLSSIHGENITINNGTISFVFKGVKYRCALAKTTKIKQASNKDDADERPVIRVDMIIDGVEVKGVELTVSDRDHMKYELLLGRETLAAGGFLVNPAVGLIDKDVYTTDTNSKSEEE